jgi:hypothetical protein
MANRHAARQQTQTLAGRNCFMGRILPYAVHRTILFFAKQLTHVPQSLLDPLKVFEPRRTFPALQQPPADFQAFRKRPFRPRQIARC